MFRPLFAAATLLALAAPADAHFRRCGVPYVAPYAAPVVHRSHYATTYGSHYIHPTLLVHPPVQYTVITGGHADPDKALSVAEKALDLLYREREARGPERFLAPEALPPVAPKDGARLPSELDKVRLATLVTNCASCHNPDAVAKAEAKGKKVPLFFTKDSRPIDEGKNFERMARSVADREMPPSGMSDTERVDVLAYLQFAPVATAPATPLPRVKLDDKGMPVLDEDGNPVLELRPPTISKKE